MHGGGSYAIRSARCHQHCRKCWMGDGACVVSATHATMSPGHTGTQACGVVTRAMKRHRASHNSVEPNPPMQPVLALPLYNSINDTARLRERRGDGA
jgi:hypothetical protein